MLGQVSWPPISLLICLEFSRLYWRRPGRGRDMLGEDRNKDISRR